MRDNQAMTSLLLPDFLIIGRMKSGTTSLGRWLAAQQEIFFCRVDEPRFFNDDDNWGRGVAWYSSMFRGAGDDQLLGESSPGYTHPDRTLTSAERISRTVPKARLIYLLRHPVERIRSHYRHARMMGDESRPFLEAIRHGDASYLRQSMYYECLVPYIQRFAREQILVVRTEDLSDATASGWRTVLHHLGLESRPAPASMHNVSVDKGLYRGPMRLRRNVELRRRLARVPKPVRRAAGRILTKRGQEFERMLEESNAVLPDDISAPLWEDVAKLEAWLGCPKPLWPH